MKSVIILLFLMIMSSVIVIVIVIVFSRHDLLYQIHRHKAIIFINNKVIYHENTQ